MTFDEAVEIAKAGNVFTVHTPVAAGNDEFPVEMMDKYFGSYYGKLGINRKQFLGLGRIDPENETEKFKMPVLAIRMSAYRNGVSQLHGEVSRKIWRGLWPDLPEDEVPITCGHQRRAHQDLAQRRDEQPLRTLSGRQMARRGRR